MKKAGGITFKLLAALSLLAFVSLAVLAVWSEARPHAVSQDWNAFTHRYELDLAIGGSLGVGSP